MSGPQPIGMLLCPICGMEFKTRAWLDWHLWKRHRQK